MDFQAHESPLLLNCAAGTAGKTAAAGTGQEGILQTVQYKNRLLYSKYDPTRAVLSLLQKNTPIDSASLILICSPCLCYGLTELFAAADAKADIIAIEADEALCAIARERLAAADREGRVTLYSGSDLAALDAHLRRLAATGTYRRVLRLDFSAGTALVPAFYAQVAAAAQEIIAFFWKNQITLVRMGRMYAKNIFQNLPRLSRSLQLFQLLRSVSRPILVCGAGESLDKTSIPDKGCCIIAVDAALPALLHRGIQPDAVVSLESQLFIQKAYIGAAAALSASPPLLFADITSRPSVPRSFPNRTVFFASRYAAVSYLDRLQEAGIVHDYTAPLGSVGLAAVAIALRLRTDESIPVFVTGLDFSYSAGRTHASGVPHDIQRHIAASRLSPAENYGAAFGPNAHPVHSKDGSTMISITSMTGYAESFRSLFPGQQNLFDIGQTGLDLALPRAENALLLEAAEKAAEAAESAVAAGSSKAAAPESAAPQLDAQVSAFLNGEKTALLTLKDLLMHGDASGFRDTAVSLDAQLRALLTGREYLYLHFPDGYRVSTGTAFLKRVRAEIDFFLKQLGLAERLLTEAERT